MTPNAMRLFISFLFPSTASTLATMDVPTLMTIPTELRMKIWRFTIPDQLTVHMCPWDHRHQIPPHPGPTFETRYDPALPLLLLNKTVNAEVLGVVDVPELVITFKDIFCVNYWLGDRRARKYLSNFRSLNFAFPPYNVPEDLQGMDEATHRSEMEADVIETLTGEAPFLALKGAEWMKRAEPRSWNLELKFDTPQTTKQR